MCLTYTERHTHTNTHTVEKLIDIATSLLVINIPMYIINNGCYFKYISIYHTLRAEINSTTNRSESNVWNNKIMSIFHQLLEITIA